MVSTLIESEKYYVIFDAGDGIYKLDQYIKKDKPIFLFLTHVHLDHTFGFHIFPKFKFKNKITVFLFKELEKDLHNLVQHPFAMPFSEMRIKVDVKGINTGKNKIPFPFECLRLLHGDPTYGYRLELDGKIIAYCLDTGICDNAKKLGKNADILIHECSNKLGISSGQWGHSDPAEAAGVAKEAGAKKLFLTHFSSNQFYSLAEIKQAENQARKIFKNTWAAKDDMQIKI